MNKPEHNISTVEKNNHMQGILEYYYLSNQSSRLSQIIMKCHPHQTPDEGKDI